MNTSRTPAPARTAARPRSRPLIALVLLAAAAVASAAPLPDQDVARIFGLLVPDADTATRQRVIREIARAGDRRFIAPQ